MDGLPLYVHIPFCASKCAYCDFYSLAGTQSVPDSYLAAVLSQARQLSRQRHCRWRTVYVGGGTPSLLSAGQLRTFCEGLLYSSQEAAGISRPEEFTVELNPDDISGETLAALEEGGVTRLSVGVQSLDDNALRTAGRRCTRTSTRAALELLRERWRGQLSLDAISGLPGQDGARFLESLAEIVSFRPDHVSLYALTLEEGTPLERAVAAGRIPYDEDDAAAQWIAGRDFLERNGYAQYEVSNFARAGRTGLHNSAYWQLSDYAGAGAGACGTFWEEGLRYTNTRDVAEYTAFWADGGTGSTGDWPAERERLSAADMEFEFLMLGLRTSAGVSSAEYARRFGGVYGMTLEERLGAGADGGLFARLTAEGRAGSRRTAQGTEFFLTRNGLLFLNRWLEQLIR